jgi:hypothetical protein
MLAHQAPQLLVVDDNALLAERGAKPPGRLRRKPLVRIY